MSTKNNSFWSFKVRRPLIPAKALLQHRPKLSIAVVCLLVAIALTVLSAYTFSLSLEPLPDASFPNWQISHQLTDGTSAGACNGANIMALSQFDMSPQARGWPLAYYYYQPGVPGSCGGVSATIYLTPVTLFTDLSLYFVVISVFWWEFGRMRQGMSAKP